MAVRLLLPVLISWIASSGGVLAQCTLTDPQKFDPSCEGIVSYASGTVFQGEEISLSFHLPNSSNGELPIITPTNSSVFSSTENFCGYESFSEGETCSISHLIINGLQNIRFVGVCSGSPEPEVSYGPAVLVLGFQAPYSCNVRLNITWGQTASLSLDVPSTESPPYQFNSSEVLVVDNYVPDLSTAVRVKCTTAESPAPFLSIQPIHHGSSVPPLTHTSNSISVDYLQGFSAQSSAVFICNSTTGYEVRGYIVTKSAIPAVVFPNGNYISAISGAPLSIPVYLIIGQPVDQSSVVVRPITGSPVSVPAVIFSNNGINANIVYDRVAVPPNPVHEICFQLMEEGSGSGQLQPMSTVSCVGNFTLNVTVPQVSITSQLIVREPAEFQAGQVTVTCTPSDPAAPIIWRTLDRRYIWEAFPSWQLSPLNLNHTLTIMSAPAGELVIIYCGIYNGPSLETLLNSYEITIVRVTSPVSVFNQGDEVLPNAVINHFRLFDSNKFLSLRCFSREEHSNLQWLTRDVTSLPDVLSAQAVNDIDALNIVSSDDGRDLTLNIMNFSSASTGYFICRSNQSGSEVEVLTTTSDPLFRLLHPSTMYYAVGSLVTLTVQYAYASEGSGNIGQNLRFDLQRGQNVLVQNIMSNSSAYMYSYSFVLGSDTAGVYEFRAVRGEFNQTAAADIIAYVPQLVSFEPVVYGLIGRRLNLSCTPNDTLSTVDWSILSRATGVYSSQLQADPQFVFLPAQLRHEVMFDLTTSTLASYGYGSQLSSNDIVQLQCSFNGSGTHNMTISVQQGIISLRPAVGMASTIHNNSIVNRFNSDMIGSRRKRIVDGPAYEVVCVTVQGDHDPQWRVATFSDNMTEVLITNTGSGLYTSAEVNRYVRTLSVTVNQQSQGKYTCKSSISGAFLTFLLVTDNPYFQVLSPRTIVMLLGRTVTMKFTGAYNSDGSSNQIDSLTVVFTATNGTIFSNYGTARRMDDANSYEFTYTLKSIGPWHSGVYSVRIHSELCKNPLSPPCLSQQNVSLTVEVPDLIPSAMTVNLVERETLQLSCLPSDGSFTISWYHNGVPIPAVPLDLHKRNALNSVLSPPYTYTNLTLASVSLADAGTYTCSIRISGMVAVLRNITVAVQALQYTCFSSYDTISRHCSEGLGEVVSVSQCCSDMAGAAVISLNEEEGVCQPCRCQADFTGGLYWPESSEGDVVVGACSAITPLFAAGPQIRRRCRAGGQWDQVDLTSCTAGDGVSSFAILWMAIQSLQGVNETTLLNNIQNYLSGHQVSADVSIENSIEMLLSGNEEVTTRRTFISFRIDLNVNTAIQLSMAASSLTEMPEFANIIPGSIGLRVFNTSSSCPCRHPETGSIAGDIIPVCSATDSSSSPCSCPAAGDNGGCQCQDPFVGDGVMCTPDSDGDGYPNTALPCTGMEPYCSTDVCPQVYNPQQDSSACSTSTNMGNCPLERDPTWSILWANTRSGATDTQRCPGGADTIGNATRYCNLNSEWEEPNVINCLPRQFQSIRDRVNEIFQSGNLSTEQQLASSADVVMELAEATNVSANTSLLPSALEVANLVMQNVINSLNVLKQQVQPDLLQGITSTISNCLQEGQLAGWLALQNERGSGRAGSNVLLENAENYAVYFSSVLDSTNNFTLVTAPNMIIAAAVVYADQKNESLRFPPPGLLENNGFRSAAAAVSLPDQLISEAESSGENISTNGILFRNLEDFLAAIDPTTRNTSRRPGSLMWSGQVVIQGESSRYQFTGDNRVNLTFELDMIENISNYTCVFWDNGLWSTEGVETVMNVSGDGGRMKVECSSSHLTAFAVLVDVSGSISTFTEGHLRALEIVSYIGIAISMICLLATIIFFTIQGKELFKSVHMLVHLNLAISLFLAYLVFAAGAEPGTSSKAACAAVAAILQYLFLAAFCWMLCEGIMLYLMLVVVFSTLAKRWYVFLIIGWVPPLVPVIIGLAAASDQYGVTNENGTLLFCWLSVQRGVIWAFVAPMLVIILINIVFFVLAMRAIYKNRKRGQDDASSKRKLAKSLLLACAILLPLLGLTWLFGLLTVNEEGAVFAWLFTIFNSTQGIAIFFFHVVRNERVWKKLQLRMKRSVFRRTQKYSLTSSDYNTQKKFTGNSKSSKLSMRAYKDTESVSQTDDGTEKANHVELNTDDAEMRVVLKEEEALRLKEEEAMRTVEEDTPLCNGVIAEGEEENEKETATTDDTVLVNPLVTGSQGDNEQDREEMETRPSEPVAAPSSPQDHHHMQQWEEEKDEEEKEEEEVRGTLEQDSSDN